MGNTTTEIKTLYERLSQLGFPEKFIRTNGLPQWWDKEAESIQGIEIEAAAYISKRLNLDIRSLLGSEEADTFKEGCGAKFKIKSGTGREHLKIAQCMSVRVAEMVAYSCIPPLLKLPGDARTIREEILENHEYVNLEALLDWCWQYGIPVVHFDRFPTTKGVHKFHGMVTYCYDRPVIILSIKDHFQARMLFTLAHELGHLVKNHLQNGTLVDENIDFKNSTDDEEMEANNFAVELLSGNTDNVCLRRQYLNPEQLKAESLSISEKYRIDPGVVIMNYAYTNARLAKNKKDRGASWATGCSALKLIGDKIDVIPLINDYLAKNIKLDRLDEDSQSYMELVMGVA